MFLCRCRVFFADLREGNEEGAVTSGNLMRPGSFRRFGTHPPMCTVVPYSLFASSAIRCCIDASFFDVSVDIRPNCCRSSSFSLVKRLTFLGELLLEDFLYADLFLSLFVGGEDFSSSELETESDTCEDAESESSDASVVFTSDSRERLAFPFLDFRLDLTLVWFDRAA